MNINKALSIQGWMEPTELQWLAEQAQAHKIIVEIGSYLGRSTRALADNTEGTVYAIDDFFGPREIQLEQRDSILARFNANLEGCKNVVVINTDHRAVNPPDDFHPDFVFIDGGHEYDNVAADIDFWRPRLAPGGLICGHDYGWCPGVDKAVNEWFPNRQIAPNTSIWWVNES